MESTTTQLNFHAYTGEQYDQDIANAIPSHRRIHREIMQYVSNMWERDAVIDVLDLGVGTGITAKCVQEILPSANLTVMDFSEKMIASAGKKLGIGKVAYLTGDYTTAVFEKGKYNLILSVIGMHHQSDVNKLLMFNKIYRALDPDTGIFIFADLMTFRDPLVAARNAALHYHHLVENAADERTLEEWAHHHMYLNKLAPVEDQLDWLKQVGFVNVQVLFQEFETTLIVAETS